MKAAILLNVFGRTPLSRRKALWGIVLIAPNTLGLLFFFGIPVLIAFYTSLHEWNAIKPATFVGLANFERLVQDAQFWNALRNTAALVLMSVPLGMALSLGVALLLNHRLPGRNFLRTAYFLPVVTSVVAASIVWTWVFQARYGLLGNILAPLGLRDVAWLTRPDLILYPVAAVTIWLRLGFDMVLFLAGLQAIPRVLYEAALIDGANRWQRLRFVTLPLLSPTTFLVMVLSIISAFQIFDQVYVMTGRTVRGGVGGSATTLSLFLYLRAFTHSEFGYASAVALVLFLVILGITVVQLAMQRRWVFYQSGAE